MTQIEVQRDTPDILVLLYTHDRAPLLAECLRTMCAEPGLPFRLWVLDNGSYWSELAGERSGEAQYRILLQYYEEGYMEHLFLLNRNFGINHALNMLMAVAKLTSNDPAITRPEYICYTNDDLVFEPGWLAQSLQTLWSCEHYSRGPVRVVSPFHCQHVNGQVAHGMQTIEHWQGFEIKKNLSGNCWVMRAQTWLEVMDWYPTDHPTEGGDWYQLSRIHKAGGWCAVTPREMAHHHPEAQGKGRYNRLGHW